jgi:hypothetical protein
VRASTAALWAGLVAAATFVPSLSGGFVYDDHRFHETNTHLGDASILWRAFADPACQTSDGTEAGLWRPLRTLSFALDHALFGASAAGPHAVNLLLHGAGASLLCLLLVRFGATHTGALLGALLYALHPAQTECVAWISSRGDLLAAAFVWGAILADLSGRARTALVLGALALLSKEQAVVWPALLWIASHLAGRGAADSTKRILAPAAVVLAFVAVRWALLPEPAQEGGLGGGPARAPELASMLGHQAWYTSFPVGGLFDWQMPPHACPWPAALVACGALAATLWPPTRWPALWFLAALVPTLFLQAVVPLNILVADRFLLFALPALAIAAARATAATGAVPAAVAALCFGALTETSLPAWTSDEALWTATADRVPGHWRANFWLGSQALSRGDAAEAVRRFRAAAESGGADAATWCMYGQSLEALGLGPGDGERAAKIRDCYTRAIPLFATPRAEGRAWLLPTAEVGYVEMTLVLGDKAESARAARLLVASPRPSMPDRYEAAWTARVRRTAAGIEKFLGDPALAASLRAWGGTS